MKTQIKIADAAGKTLENIFISSGVYANQCVIVFTDGTFVTLGIKRGYEAGDEAIEEQELYTSQFGDDGLVKAGILTLEEMTERRRKDAEEAAKVWEARERENYERLKRKFGG